MGIRVIDSGWRKVSQEGYLIVEAQQPVCTRCDARFRVTRTTDYDRPTWSWTTG